MDNWFERHFRLPAFPAICFAGMALGIVVMIVALVLQ